MRQKYIVYFLALLLSACVLRLSDDGDVIMGNKKVIIKIIQTKEYDQIKSHGSIDVYYEQGKEGHIRLEAEENLMDYIEVTEMNGCLNLSIKSGLNYITFKGLKAYVPIQTIDELHILGSGDMQSQSTIHSKALELYIEGSGDMDLDLNTERLKAEILGSGDMNIKTTSISQLDSKVLGSGDMTMSGSCDNINLEINGSGDFLGFELKSKDVDVNLKGSGDVYVYSESELNVNVLGSGDVVYKSKPSTKNLIVKGSGEISKY